MLYLKHINTFFHSFLTILQGRATTNDDDDDDNDGGTSLSGLTCMITCLVVLSAKILFQ